MKITTLLKKEMKKGVTQVLKGEIESFECDHIPPAMIAEYMDDLGFVRSDLETNGWDYDWWLHFTKDGKSYTACGSGYYGWFEFGPTEE